MPKTHLSPHDRYIRSILSNAPVAREFFEKHLPKEVLKAIDFSTLEPQKDSFINDKLHLQVADLLFSVNFNGDPGYLYLLLEHTSKPDRFLPYRMLQYTLGIMDQHLKKLKDQKIRKKKLPLIVPLILYTGKRPYTYSTDLFDLFGQEKELARSIFLSPYQLIDLHKIPDETLREAYYWFGAAALTAKHIRNADLVSLIKSMINLLERLKNEGLDSYVFITLSYVFEAGKVTDEEAYREIIRSDLSDGEKEKVMTLAEIFRQKGYQEAKEEAMVFAEQYRQKGKVEGKLEGKLEALHATALNLFKIGMTIEQVSEATELSREEVQDLWNQNTSIH